LLNSNDLREDFIEYKKKVDHGEGTPNYFVKA